MFIGFGIGLTSQRLLSSAVGSAPINTALPLISGLAIVGQTLTTTTGGWYGSGTLSYAYQWEADGVNISGATVSSYDLTASEEGAVITVTVTATNAAGSAAATSDPTEQVQAAPLVFATFADDTEGFSAGTRVAAEGADLETGFFRVGAGVTAERTFTAISSGISRVDFKFRISDTETIANTTKNTFFYLLPTSGTVSSANSIATITLSRSTGNGATAGLFAIQYRAGASFVYFGVTWPRGAHWFEFSVVVNWTAKTYDLYMNGALFEVGKAWANAAAADFSRVVILGDSAAPNTDFDDITVHENWALPTESIMIADDFTARAGEVEATAPDTDDRNLFPQPWLVPDGSTYGAFTRGASGLVPDVAKECLSMARCGPEGKFEADWTAASSGVIYMGMMFRVWAGLGTDSFLLLRYYSGATAGQQLRLFQGSTMLGSSDGTAGGVSYSASGAYTLRVDVRGRFAYCYVNDQLQFGAPINIGNRGQLSEENAGPYIDTSLGDVLNRCTAFRYTGRPAKGEFYATVGTRTMQAGRGGVPELYDSELTLDERNLFWSKGIQNGHVSEADMGNYVVAQRRLISTPNLQVYRQRALCLKENAVFAAADVYVTVRRSGLWVADRLTYLTTTAGINFTPDLDLRPELWGLAIRTIDATGASAAATVTVGSTWTTRQDSANHVKAFQLLTANSGNKLRMMSALRSNENVAGVTHGVLTKREGNGDPFSVAFNYPKAGLSFGTAYEAARTMLLETGAGLALSDTDLVNYRDDITTPAVLDIAGGTLKTDASGDIDVDGFNERYGWHEIDCSSGLATFTLELGTPAKRHRPAFRLNGWTEASVRTVTIEGVSGVSGTDYVLDDLGDGTAILQLLTNRTADTLISVE